MILLWAYRLEWLYGLDRVKYSLVAGSSGRTQGCKRICLTRLCFWAWNLLKYFWRMTIFLHWPCQDLGVCSDSVWSFVLETRNSSTRAIEFRFFMYLSGQILVDIVFRPDWFEVTSLQGQILGVGGTASSAAQQRRWTDKASAYIRAFTWWITLDNFN